jgi:hypothetical protein
MALKEEYFDKFSNEAKLKNEQKRLIKLFDEIETKMKDLSRQGINISLAGSIREVEATVRSLEKTAAELSVVRKEYAITASKVIKLKEEEARATKELTLENVRAKQAQKERNRELVLQANYMNAAKGSVQEHLAMIAILENNLKKLDLTKAEDLIIQDSINKKLKEYNALVAAGTGRKTPQAGITPDPNNQPKDVPFETNLADLEKQNRLLEKQGEVVNQNDKEYADLVMTTNEWADAQKQATEATKEGVSPEVVDNVVKYKDELESLTGTLAENQEILSLYKKELGDVQDEIKLMESSTNAAQKASPRFQQRLEELRVTEAKLKKEIKDANTLIQAQAQAAINTSTSLKGMQARYEQLTIVLNKMNDAQRASPQGIRLTQEAKQLDVQIQRLRKSSGQLHDSTNNMSNAATRSLGRVIGYLRNIAYLIPGIGIAGLIGLLYEGFISLAKAIYDGSRSLNEFKEKYRALNEAVQGGEFTDAVKNVETLRIEIGLAKQGFIDKEKVVKHYNETIGKTTGEVKNLDEAEQQLKDNAPAFIKFTLLKAAASIALANAAKAAVDQAERDLDFLQQIEELGTQSGTRKEQVDTLGSTIALPTSGTPTDEAAETEKKLVEERNKAQATSQKRIDFQTKIATDFLKQAALIGKMFKDFDFFGGAFDDKDKGGKDKDKNAKFFDDLLKRQKEAFLEIAKDEDRNIQDRIEARTKAFILEAEIINGKRKADIINAKGNAEEIKNINAAANAEIIDGIRKANSDIFVMRTRFMQDLVGNAQATKDVNKKLLDELQKDRNEAIQSRGRVLQSQAESELAVLEDQYNQELALLEKKHNKGKISDDKYNKEKLKLEAKYQADVLRIQIQAAEDQLEIERALAEAETDPLKKQERLAALDAAQDKLGAMRSKLVLLVEAIKKMSNATGEEFKDMFEKIATYAQAAVDLISGLGAASAEKEKNRLQEQMDLLDARAEKEAQVIEQTITNERDKAAALQALETRTNQQRRIYEIQQRQADERKARFEKASTISSIVLNTALAVIKAFQKEGLLGAIAAAALGAAQLAVAVATPVPKYAKGGTTKKGLGIAGEKGRELMVDNKGKLVMFDKPTLTSFVGGEKIYSNKVTEDILASIDGAKININGSKQKEQDNKSNEILGELKRLNKKPPVVVAVSEGIEAKPYYVKHMKGHI